MIDPLHNAGNAVHAARIKTPVEFQLALRKQEWDLALAPVQQPGFPPKQAIALLKHAKLDVPFIVMLDDCGDEDIVEALSNGASAIVKRHNLTQLRNVVERELLDLSIGARATITNACSARANDAVIRCWRPRATPSPACAQTRSSTAIPHSTASARRPETGPHHRSLLSCIPTNGRSWPTSSSASISRSPTTSAWSCACTMQKAASSRPPSRPPWPTSTGSLACNSSSRSTRRHRA